MSSAWRGPSWKSREAPRTAFMQRRGPPAPGRGWWPDALETCIAAGELVAEGGEMSPQQAFEIAGIAAKAGEVPFPLSYASAWAAAAGLHQLVRGFSGAGHGELRVALGLALAAAARCCRRFLELELEQKAAAMRRQLGDDD